MGNFTSRYKRAAEDDGMLERPAHKHKRPRLCEDALASSAAKDDGPDEENALALPPEVWAMVVNYLDYQSVLSCAATSRSMLHDALPMVTMLHIDKSSEMNAILASRFRDVREVNIYSLLQEIGAADFDEDDVPQLSVDYDAVMRVVPFLSRFPSLQRVFLGGKKSSGEEVGFCSSEHFWDEEEDPNRSQSLIDMTSGSFRCFGGLPRTVRVLGLRCPFSCESATNDEVVSDCEVCQRACQSFPVSQVINFENKGSSANYDNALIFSPKRSYDLDVCLPRSQIESIIEARPGGGDLLRSDARFLCLLGRGSRYEIHPDNCSPLYVLEYSNMELEELERVIEYAQLNVKNIAREDVTRAIMRSFAIDDRAPTPTKDRCYLSRGSFNHLKDKMGLSINEEDFGFEAANAKNLPHIAHAMMNGNAGIRNLAISFLYRILNNCDSLAIQQVIDLGLVQELLQMLQRNNSKSNDQCMAAAALYSKSKDQLRAASALGNIVKKGTIAHTQVVVDAGAVPKLISLLSSVMPSVAKNATLALGRIATKSAALRDAVVQSGTIPALLQQALKWSHSESYSYVLNTNLIALKRLVCERLVRGYPTLKLDEMEIRISLQSLFRLLSNDNEEPLSYACSALALLVDAAKRHKEVVIADAGVLSRLLGLLSHTSKEVQAAALDVIRRLGPSEKVQIWLVASSIAVPSLITCMSSSIEPVRVNALDVITSTMNGTKHKQAFLAQCSVQPLCDMLSSGSPVVNTLVALKLLAEKLDFMINITDNEKQAIKDKLGELENLISWKNLRQRHILMKKLIIDVRLGLERDE